MRFIIVLFLLVTSFAYSQWTPYNVNMQVKGKFRADKQIYFPLGADSGKVWVCINDSTGLGEWRTVGGGGSIDTSNFWNINGNSGTNSATNFIGTTDSKDFTIKTNGIERSRFGSNGQWITQSSFSPNDTFLVSVTDNALGFGLGAARLQHATLDGQSGAVALDGSGFGKTRNYSVYGFTDFAAKNSFLETGYDSTSRLAWVQLQVQNNVNRYTVRLATDTGLVVNCPLYYTDGTQGAGKILTSDANGLAYWDTISGGGGATGATGATGSTGATGATGNTGATGTTVPNSLTFSYGITGATSYDGSSAQTIKADTSTSGINLATQGYADRGDVWVLLSTVTASNSATVDFTGLDSGSYVIFYTNVIPTTTSATLNFRYGTGGTPTYQTSNYAYSVSFNLNTGTAITTSNSTSAGSFVLHGVTTGTGEGVSGVLTMLNPSGTSIYHPMTFTANDFNAGNNYYFTGGGCWKSTTAVTAGRFYFSSGNISSGTFKIYKIK